MSTALPADSPQQAAIDWVHTVAAGDFNAVWHGMETDNRLCLTQQWVWGNRSHPAIESWDRDQLACVLTAGDTTCPLWPAFAEAMADYIASGMAALAAAPLYALGDPRPLDLDTELVLLTHEHWDGSRKWDQIAGRAFLMELVAGRWLVAGFWTSRATPGWPPVYPDMTGPLNI